MLARDARLGDIETVVDFSTYEDGSVPCEVSTVDFDHFYCFEVTDSKGYKFKMVDYPTAGRTWNAESLTTVWMPTRDYWSVDMTKPVKFIAPPVWENGPGYCFSESESGLIGVSVISDKNAIPSVILEDCGDGYVKIRLESGRYIGIRETNVGTVTVPAAVADECGAQWKLEKFAQDRYKLVAPDGLHLRPCTADTGRKFRRTGSGHNGR